MTEKPRVTMGPDELAIELFTSGQLITGGRAEAERLLQQIKDRHTRHLAAVPSAPADRTAVLADEAALIELHCPDHGPQDQDGVWMDCHCPVAEDMRKRAADPSRMADEAQQPASTAPLAANLPLVKGRCPACNGASLFLGDGGYVTCSRIDCPEPDAASTALEQPAVGAQQAAQDRFAALKECICTPDACPPHCPCHSAVARQADTAGEQPTT